MLGLSCMVEVFVLGPDDSRFGVAGNMSENG